MKLTDMHIEPHVSLKPSKPGIDVVELAREANMDVGMTATIMCSETSLARFAAQLLEKVAKFCDEYGNKYGEATAHDIATAIREMK